METLLKQLVKEAVLEALVEFANGGIALAVEPEQTFVPDSPDGNNNSGNGTKSGEDESGKGGASGETSGGGVGPGGRPKPDVGVGVFGLR